MLKITKINDAGWYSMETLEINSASELTLLKIVDTIRKNISEKVVKITNGQFDKNKNIISFQILVKDRNKLNWMEMPIYVRFSFDAMDKLQNRGEIIYQREKSAVSQKLKTFTNKVIYEDKTFRTDSVKDEYNDADLQFLIDDEIEAINGYKKIIEKTDNPKLLALLSHILKEEAKHVEELRAAQAGKFKVDD